MKWGCMLVEEVHTFSKTTLVKFLFWEKAKQISVIFWKESQVKIQKFSYSQVCDHFIKVGKLKGYKGDSG